jgi:hypothetical protein
MHLQTFSNYNPIDEYTYCHFIYAAYPIAISRGRIWQSDAGLLNLYQ